MNTTSSNRTHREHAGDCGQERAYDQAWELGARHAGKVAAATADDYATDEFYTALEAERDACFLRFGPPPFGSVHAQRGYDDGYEARMKVEAH